MFEPFIGTANQAVDDWTLSLALDAQGAGAKQAAYEQHFRCARSIVRELPPGASTHGGSTTSL